MYGLQTCVFLFFFLLLWGLFCIINDVCFCPQLCFACHKAGCPQMHEMIKMSLMLKMSSAELFFTMDFLKITEYYLDF